MGNNVAAALGHRRKIKPFTFKTLGAFADIGRHKAVANLMGLRVRGFPAWAVCRFYHLAWVPGIQNKSRLIADWTVEFIFPRNIAELGQLGHPPVLEGEHGAPGSPAPEDVTVPDG
jgi:NADH dehydrogenase